MSNVTYITFKKWPNNYWYSMTTNNSTLMTINNNNNNNNNLTTNLTTTTINFPSNVILLIEEQNENVQKLFNGNKYGMALMISAILLILIGCCCICNWFNQNSKIRTTIIPSRNRNNILLLGHGKIISNCRPRRQRQSIRCTEGTTNHTSYNDDVVTDNAECNNNNNNTIERMSSVQQIRRNRIGVVVDSRVDDNNCNIESDRTNPSADQPDVMRRYDLDVESLPSYTLCSGLPSYDAALDEFRKAGIILKTTPSVVKIFENTSSKEHLIGNNNFDSNNDSTTSASSSSSSAMNNNETINSCKCGGSSSLPTNLVDGIYENGTSSLANQQSPSIESIIELSPEQLNMLSEKRLSLQIAFNSSIRRIQPNRDIDLRREVLRSHEIPAAIHRSSSLRLIPRYLNNNNESQQEDVTRIPSPKHLKLNMNRHRGSIV